jgi:hypothetical protein
MLAAVAAVLGTASRHPMHEVDVGLGGRVERIGWASWW